VPGARCRLFAYCPPDATAIPEPHHLVPHLNPSDLPFWYRLTQSCPWVGLTHGLCWVGSGWVENFLFLVGWVGLGPL